MNLPYIDSAISIANAISIAIPCTLGVMRALDKRVGLFIILFLVSSLIGWMCLNFVKLSSGWDITHQVSVLQSTGTAVPENLMRQFTNDGASNAFASLLGWVPAALAFLIAYGVVRLLVKITSSKKTKRTSRSS